MMYALLDALRRQQMEQYEDQTIMSWIIIIPLSGNPKCC